MKLSILVFLLLPLFVYSQTDEDLVKATIESAYINGVHNGGPVEDIQKGFHPSFIMFRLNKNELVQIPLQEWINNITKGRSTATNNEVIKADPQYTHIVVEGYSANVILDLYRGDKKLFTDHLLLYKFQEGWRIVSKTFLRH